LRKNVRLVTPAAAVRSFEESRMATFLSRLGRGAFRRRGRVLAAWIVVLVALVGVLLAFGGKLDNEFSIPGSESQQARDVLGTEFPAASGTNAQIVFTAPAGSKITTPKYQTAITASLAAAAKAPQVAGVIAPAQSGLVSADKRTALAEIEYKVQPAGLASGTLDGLEATVAPAKAAGLTVHVGGPAYDKQGVSVSAKELLGVAFALAVLVVTFGSVLAAGMPLVSALVGVGVGLAGLLALTGVAEISSTAITLGLMIGLAVGIDYALFILSRHRTQLVQGVEPEESAGLANGTAGSAVVFAGLTVIIALAGLSIVGIPFLTVMGLGAAGTVLIAVFVALTLVPALLGFAGARLVPKPGSRAARRSDPAVSTGGQRWARFVTRKPALTVLAVVVGLLVVAIPAKDLRLALPDAGSAAQGSPQRVTYDAITGAFGPGFNGPLLLLVDLKNTQDQAAREQAMAYVIQDLSTLDDVAAISTARYSADARYSVIQVIPSSAPDAQKTTDLVDAIRGQAPVLHTKQSIDIQVTGNTAVAIDVSDKLSAALVPFAAIVVGLCLILLLIVFRSLVVPVKATVGFLLSVGASFGATAAVFEWGWLSSLLGVAKTGPVISFLPIILIAVLFGLAMDYEVFMVSSMREEWTKNRQALPSVITGARQASRVVTAAALIMFSVFATFATTDDAIIKPIAFSLAFGVLVDAFLVRMTLVPAVLALVGEGAWSLPSWLDRALPHVDLEGEALLPDAAASPEPEAVAEPAASAEPASETEPASDETSVPARER
jgi:RND superfamily putative drug exporter